MYFFNEFLLPKLKFKLGNKIKPSDTFNYISKCILNMIKEKKSVKNDNNFKS